MIAGFKPFSVEIFFTGELFTLSNSIGHHIYFRKILVCLSGYYSPTKVVYPYYAIQNNLAGKKQQFSNLAQE